MRVFFLHAISLVRVARARNALFADVKAAERNRLEFPQRVMVKGHRAGRQKLIEHIVEVSLGYHGKQSTSVLARWIDEGKKVMSFGKTRDLGKVDYGVYCGKAKHLA